MRTTDPTAPMTEGSPEPPGDFRYFIGRIPRSLTQRDLEQYFGAYGDLMSLTLKRDAAGNLRGYGWIQYRSPPVNLIRPEPHVLRGTEITVEQARSRGPFGNSRPERRVQGGDRNVQRRRRRSYSPSHSSSLSSSFSGFSKRENRRQFSPSRPKSPRNNAQLPSISVGSCRLPPLMGQMFSSASAVQAPLSTPGYNNVGPAVNPNPAPSVSDTYLCIPTTLCPPEYLNDPRTFFVKLDPNRVGSLNIVPAPFAPSSSTSAVNSMPPPPPPTKAFSQSVSLGSRTVSNTMDSLMSELHPAKEHGGMNRRV